MTHEEWESVGISTVSHRAAYLEVDIPETLKKDFEVVGRMAQEMVQRMLDKNLDGAIVYPAAASFMKLASVIKDDYFKHEGESRLVAMRYKAEMNGKGLSKYMSGKMGLHQSHISSCSKVGCLGKIVQLKLSL